MCSAVDVVLYSGVKSTRKLYSSKSFVTDKKLLEVKYKVPIKKST